jgi:gamma-glutamyltranspeptidase/glutathione hydrolase
VVSEERERISMVDSTTAAGSPIAAEAGSTIAARGGNGVDAAITAAIVSMCTDLGVVSPGGGAFVTLWPPDGDPVVVDGFVTMPGLDPRAPAPEDAMREVVFDYHGPTRQKIGWGSIATPGAFAALALASARYGALPWATLLEPAIQLTRTGFPLTGGAAEYLSYTHAAIFGWHPPSHRLLHHEDGSPLVAGETVRLPALADTLELMARDPASLYRGSLAERLASGIGAQGGTLGLADLQAYEAVERTPLHTRIGAWDVASNPPPAVGGACLAAMLLLLDRRTCAPDDLAATVQHMVSTQHAVLGYRQARLDGMTTELPAAVEHMLSLAATGDPTRLTAPSTSHVSAVDETGLACAITMSSGYGSGALVEGTGIWLNNALGEVDMLTRGLASTQPGMRLASNMAPTVARRDDGAMLAIGSPGASRITTALAQVLANFTLNGMDLYAAVHHPRLHVEPAPHQRSIAYEPSLPVHEMEGLVPRPFTHRSMYFGGVQAVALMPGRGLTGVADDRRGGSVASSAT